MNLNKELIEETFTEDLYRVNGKVIVLIPDEWSVMAPSEIELLQKILGAIKLSIHAVHVLSKDKVNLEELMVFEPSVVLSFGTIINHVESKYQISEVLGFKVVLSDKVGSLDDQGKKSLWTALKQLFAPA